MLSDPHAARQLAAHARQIVRDSLDVEAVFVALGDTSERQFDALEDAIRDQLAAEAETSKCRFGYMPASDRLAAEEVIRAALAEHPEALDAFKKLGIHDDAEYAILSTKHRLIGAAIGRLLAR